MHHVERDIRNWSHNFLEVPNEKLNGLPPCPYAKQAWLDNKVTFSINTGIEVFDTCSAGVRQPRLRHRSVGRRKRNRHALPRWVCRWNERTAIGGGY